MSAHDCRIIPHAWFRDRDQARRMDWIKRKAAHKRGEPTPLQWADVPEDDDKDEMRRALDVLFRKLRDKR